MYKMRCLVGKQILAYSTNKDADKSACPRIVISSFFAHCLDSIMILVSRSEMPGLNFRIYS